MLEMLGARLGIEAGAFLAGERVEISTDSFQCLRNLMGAAASRAFEEHVLDKMGGAIERGRFESASYPNPEPHAHTGHMGHRRRGDSQPVGKSVDLVPHACSGVALLRPKKEEGQKIVGRALDFTVHASRFSDSNL